MIVLKKTRRVRIGCLISTSILALTPMIMKPSSAAAAGSAPAAASGDVATNYLINAVHDDNVSGATETPGAPMKWSRYLGGEVSYPIIVPGHVFVTVVNPTGTGTTLHALNPANGLDQWSYPLPGVYHWSTLTYGGGLLYALTNDGLLTALNPATGTARWSELIPRAGFDAPPTFKGGRLYLSGSGTVFGLDARSGDIMWTQPVENGDISSPTVSSAGVYVTYACQQDYGFNPTTGTLLWHDNGPCEGGGGQTAPLGAGYLWSNPDAGASTPMVLNPADGTQVTNVSVPYGGWVASPAFAGGTGFFNANGTLTALKPTAAHSRWKFAGDGHLTGVPLVANGYVYMGSDLGNIYALNETTGVLAWTDNVGAPIPSYYNNPASPPNGLAAGQGLLIVPATDVLVAYGH